MEVVRKASSKCLRSLLTHSNRSLMRALKRVLKRVHSQASGSSILRLYGFPLLLADVLQGDVNISSHGCPSWVGLLAHVFMELTDRRSLCVFLAQTGVPGFLTDMQKACSNYSSYCQKKWTQLAHAQGLKFIFLVFSFGYLGQTWLFFMGRMWHGVGCYLLL